MTVKIITLYINDQYVHEVIDCDSNKTLFTSDCIDEAWAFCDENNCEVIEITP